VEERERGDGKRMKERREERRGEGKVKWKWKRVLEKSAS
jgi:hypothetical protein